MLKDHSVFKMLITTYQSETALTSWKSLSQFWALKYQSLIFDTSYQPVNRCITPDDNHTRLRSILNSYLTYEVIFPYVFKDNAVYGVILLSWLSLSCISFSSFNCLTSFKVSSCLFTSFLAFQVIFGFSSLLGGLRLIFSS